jgi:hypothetical protein
MDSPGQYDLAVKLVKEFALIDEYQVVDRGGIGDDNHSRPSVLTRSCVSMSCSRSAAEYGKRLHRP